jgi:3-methylfumaryl-CoA hydratase
MTLSTETLDTATLAHLQGWAGRSETLLDTATAAPVRALSATLDRDDPVPVAGDPLPALWHWLYFLPQHRHGEIGSDGHARRGGFLPPVPLPRRMWAGGRLQWEAANPLRVGDALRRVSSIESVTHKRGRSGDLLFVLVRHAISNDAGLCLTEEHDIVYRAAAQPSEATTVPLAADQSAPWQREVLADAVLLFRYSALTFNSHRIHYDRSYVTQEEGYPGLVVHGPLIATLMLDLVRRHLPDATIGQFSFKALRPTFDQYPLRLYAQPAPDGRSLRVWASDHEGWLTMQGDVALS